MAWSADERWEYSARGIITRESGLHHARAIVKNDGCDFIFHPGVVCLCWFWLSFM
jgi:hypothetical protein